MSKPQILIIKIHDTCRSWKIPPVRTSLAGRTSTAVNSPASFSSISCTHSSSRRVTSLHLQIQRGHTRSELMHLLMIFWPFGQFYHFTTCRHQLCSINVFANCIWIFLHTETLVDSAALMCDDVSHCSNTAFFNLTIKCSIVTSRELIMCGIKLWKMQQMDLTISLRVSCILNQFWWLHDRVCVCVTAPFSEGSGLGLNHSQVPQCQVPAMVGLLVTVHFNSHCAIGQKFHKLLRHCHRQLLKKVQNKTRIHIFLLILIITDVFLFIFELIWCGFVTLALSKTTVHWGSLEVEDKPDGSISGAMNTGSTCPQKWYWQKTKFDRWRGRPLAWRIFTWERGEEKMHSSTQKHKRYDL